MPGPRGDTSRHQRDVYRYQMHGATAFSTLGRDGMRYETEFRTSCA
jgi:hypothetical protein